MSGDNLREPELAGGVGRRLEPAGWAVGRNWRRARQELQAGNWQHNCRYEFNSRKFGFLYTESHNNLEFANRQWEEDRVQFYLS